MKNKKVEVINEWQRESARLKKELDQKNRDLEIEAALERVRARTMAMHQSRELSEAATVLFQQILALDLKPVACAFIIVDETAKAGEVFISADGTVIPQSFVIPYHGEPAQDKIFNAWQSRVPYIVVDLVGENLHTHLKFIAENMPVGDMLEASGQPQPERLALHIINFKHGFLGINFTKPNESVVPILQRFAKVFEQTYTRFLDLQKAEAQAREAQIEAALERVRAASMAMHKSDEISDVASVLFHQLQQLDVTVLRRCLIGIVDETNAILQSWYTSMQGDSSHKIIMYPISGHPIIEEKINGWRQQKPFSIEMPGEKLEDFLQYAVNHGFEYQKGEVAATYMIQNHAPFTYGYLEVATHEIIADQDFELLQRFAKVFEQTYTRFLDLQKAEAQTRESEIQLALERVRSRSMAMHNSNELTQVVALVYEQLSKLGFDSWGYLLRTREPGRDGFTTWLSLQDMSELPEGYYLPKIDHPIHRQIWQAWEKQEEYKVIEFGGDEKKQYDELLFTRTEWKKFPEHVKNRFRSADHAVICFSSFRHIGLQTAGNQALPPEQANILVRFARVFEQTYTRFLDLQKAEAQAREAEIQLALERVRARTMAMHKSEELSETAAVMFKELKKLGIDSLRSGVCIFNFDDDTAELWLATESGHKTETKVLGTVTGAMHPMYKQWIDAGRQNKQIVRFDLSGDDLLNYYKIANAQLNLPNRTDYAKQEVYYGFIFPGGSINIISETPLTNEECEIGNRFANVFGLLYCRFQDLQQAEAQAREAQIEAALERVRARTMAMHKSEELSEAATVLFQQLRKLGGNLWSAGFVLLDKHSEEGEFRMSNPEGEIQLPIFIPSTTDPATKNMYYYWKKGFEYYEESAGGKKLKQHYDYLQSLPKARDAFQAILDAGIKLPSWQQWHAAYFSAGYLLIITMEPYEEVSLLKRFAKAFQQTYTRFLDLEKAEAQAREAQIETALERIRAKAMAMQNSNELIEVANTLREQMRLLEQPELESMMVVLYDEKNFTEEDWFAFLPPKGKRRKILTGSVKWRLDENEVVKKLFKLYKSGVSESTFHVKGQDLKELHEDLKEKIPVMVEYYDGKLPESVIHHVTRFSGGHLLMTSYEAPDEKSKDLQKRVTNTFDLAYKRFLDLKKAEAQAREAQIEAALERVRAKSMAMHKSEELRELVFEFYKQIHPFGFAKWGFEIKIAKEDKSGFYCWISPPGARIQPESFNIPTLDHWVLEKYWSIFENQLPIAKIEVSGDDKKRLGLLLLKKSDMKHLPQEVKTNILDTDYVHFSVASMRFGLLKAVDIEPVPEKDVNILQRFANVFEQTYTRFLDLQKAEAQAREAQIEAALERVRARSMGMHRSEELLETAQILFQQLKELGVELHVCGFSILDKDSPHAKQYISIENKLFPEPLLIRLDVDPYLMEPYEDWKKGKTQLILDIQGKALEKHLTVQLNQFKSLGSADILINQARKYSKRETQQSQRLVVHHAFFRYGFLFLTYDQPIDDIEILVRFAKVFEQTYTRFLDLQKAEAHAREAEIQLALERVRARTMAMHKSEELREVVAVLYEQMIPLGIATLGCELILCDEQNKQLQYWSAVPEQAKLPECFPIPIGIHPFFIKLWHAWEKRTPRLVVTLKGQEKRKFDNLIFEKTAFKNFPESAKKSIKEGKVDVFSLVSMKYGLLEAVDVVPLPEHNFLILERFANVFEQTYTRFLDLQKAEAQARESQIEAALERVRARSMAMHSTEELVDVSSVVYEELKKLGIITFQSCGFHIIDEQNEIQQVWNFHIDLKQLHRFQMPIKGNPILNARYAAWKQRENVFYQKVGGQQLNDLLEFISDQDINLGSSSSWIEKFGFPNPVHFHFANFSRGYLHVIAEEIMSEEHKTVLVRFAKVFDQTYTRFLDLQKAEVQARESQIETALERIRSRTMAMQKTDELLDAAGLLYKELFSLGIDSLTSGYVLMDKDEKIGWNYDSSPADGSIMPEPLGIPHTETKVMRSITSSWKKQEPFQVIELDPQQTIDHQTFIAERTPNFPYTAEELISFSPTRLVLHTFNFKEGYLLMINGARLATDQIEMMIRFTRAFEQTYTRFLDLQKAEAQAWEAEIQLALERVRARTMAMHKSEELGEVLGEFFKQMNPMGLAQWGCALWLADESTPKFDVLFTSPADPDLPISNEVPVMDRPIIRDLWAAYKNQVPHFNLELKGKEKKNFDSWFLRETGMKSLPEEVKNEILLHDYVQFSFVSMRCGLLGAIDVSKIEKEQIGIVQRFAQVFDQTYTRFLDLQKAEAQAREAEIQLALERVRARTLAMHQSNELSEAGSVLFQQLVGLGIKAESSWITLIHPEENAMTIWLTHGTQLAPPRKVNAGDHPNFKAEIEAWKSGEEYINISMPKGAFNQVSRKAFEMELENDYPEEKLVHIQNLRHRFGYLGLATLEPIRDKDVAIYSRFTKVFEQTYTRFLDLQKAEAQAREAQIEVALERIRARALAMHTSAELEDVAIVLREQMQLLGQTELIGTVVELYETHPDQIESWHAFRPAGNPDAPMETGVVFFEKNSCAVMREMIERYKGPLKQYTIEASGKKIREWYKVLREVVPKIKNITIPEQEFYHCADFSGGTLLLASLHNPSVEAKDLLMRSATVFDLAYTRFLDLQKAEAQAREAQIEAALERIRSRALAMQSSADLLDVSIVLREQMGILGQPELESSIIHLYNDNETLEAWYTFRSTETNSTKIITDKAVIPINSCDYIKETIAKYNSKDAEYTIVSKGKKLAGWYNVMVKVAPDTIEYDDKGKMIIPEILYYHYSKFSGGSLLMISNQQPSEEAKELQFRAAKVFNLAYQRFLDLQKAEARTRESIKQASLDRVRGEIASMRTSEDLNRLTPVIWHELKALEVPFFRCGVFIVDDVVKKVDTYLSNPEGESLAAWRSDYDTIPLFNASVKAWKKQQVYCTEWDRKQFMEFSQILVDQGLVRDVKRYQAGQNAPEYLALQMIPFKQGMLYVGSAKKLNDDQIELVQALASAFSIAYSRYEDFRQLEKAKSEIEHTLSELRSTQTQLIHSEKMASLGELTAGIAHEIQNPLNFVNNFSEVSKELVFELKAEREKLNSERDVSLEEELLDDVIQNLEKISHHGKRASDIVKGMLQHSRVSTGEKEPTDINTLADEYLRLAYHGLRAKDKSFNANFKTELDHSVPKVKVIGQDIGRVLLNLINNAFYAVSSKALSAEQAGSATEDSDYKPEVIVKTKKMDSYVEIRVIDNGNGISSNVLDKIFQPFFTTKPTGQGTGLGLSLSYDIITKGHDGYLEVDTMEGFGTTFIIKLPVK